MEIGKSWRDIINPKSTLGFVILWIFVFALIFAAISFEKYLVAQKSEEFSELIRGNLNWMQHPYRPPYESRLEAQYFEEDLEKQGKQFFGEPPKVYNALVKANAEDIRYGHFSMQQVDRLVGDLQNVYTDFLVNRNEILRKQGFYYFTLLVIIVFSYQSLVHIAYLFLNSTATATIDGKEDQYDLFTEGAFNAIDLAILAAVTSIYFDSGSWVVSAVIFLGYAIHMIIFGLFLLTIKDRRAAVVAGVYLLSVLMPIVLAAIAIGSMQYFLIALAMLTFCGAFGILAVVSINIFGGVPRLRPYSALTARPPN